MCHTEMEDADDYLGMEIGPFLGVHPQCFQQLAAETSTAQGCEYNQAEIVLGHIRIHYSSEYVALQQRYKESRFSDEIVAILTQQLQQKVGTPTTPTKSREQGIQGWDFFFYWD